MFKAIAEAYDTLGDPAKRAEFDRIGSFGAAGVGSASGARFSFAKADAMFHDIFASMHGMGFEEGFRLRREDAMPSGYARRPDASASFAEIFNTLESAFGHFADIESPPGSASSAGFSAAWGTRSHSGSGGHTSISSHTESCTVGGRTFTRTVTTRRHPDGRVETTTDESGARDLDPMLSRMDRLPLGEPADRRSRRLMPARLHAPSVAMAPYERARGSAARRARRPLGSPSGDGYGDF